MAPPSADAVTGAEEIGAHGSSWDVRRQLRAETTKRVATELRAVALQATVTRQDEKLGNLESVRSLEGDALEEAAQQARVKIQQLLARLDASGPLPGVTRPAPPALPGPAVVPVGRPRKRTAQKIEELRSSRPAAGRSPEKSRDDRLEELRRVQAKKQTREQTVARLQAVQAFNDAYDRSAARTDPAGEATPTSAPTARRQVQAGTVAAPAAGKRVEGKPGESQIASELEERAQSARSAEQVAFRPAPPAAKPGSPPPPPPQSLPETQQFLQAASGSGRQELLQLVELFPETKQFLRKVDTNDRSVPQVDSSPDDDDDDDSTVSEGVPPPPTADTAKQDEAMQLIKENPVFVGKLEGVVVDSVEDLLKSITIPAIDGDMEAQKYRLWNMKIKGFGTRPKVSITTEKSVRVEIRDIDLQFEHFDFTMDRHMFPQVKDTGVGEVSCNCGCEVAFEIKVDEDKNMTVDNFSANVTIDKLVMDILTCKHKECMKTWLKMFQKVGKESVQDEILKATQENISMISDRISELFSRQVGGKSEPDELKKGAASQNDSEVSARPLTAAGPAAELRPVPQELANRRAHELPPPPPTGETAAHFAEWRVPSSTGGTGSAAREVMPQAERRREAGRGGSGRRELCPPPPAGEVAAYFAEWGVPAVAAAAAAAPVPGLQEVALRKLTGDHRRVEPSARELGQRELCPPRPTGEVAAYFAEWGVVVPVDAAAAAPRRGLSVRRTPF
jgi:hypothetical protein